MNGIQITIGDDIRAAYARWSASQEPAEQAGKAFVALFNGDRYLTGQFHRCDDTAKTEVGRQRMQRAWLKEHFGGNAVELWERWMDAQQERTNAYNAYAALLRDEPRQLQELVLDMLKAGK